MKHINTYQLFESVHDTKEEIEEIVSTCKDILLEANDTFSSNSNVEKSYKDDYSFYGMTLHFVRS